MSLKLSCSDFSFPLLPHKLALPLIAGLGFEGVDIGLFGGGSQLSPQSFLGGGAAAARDLSKQVTDVGLAFADIYLIPGSFDVLAPNHPDATERTKSRDLFSRCLEATVAVGSKHMTALPGIPWKTESLEASTLRSTDELAWRVEKASAAGVVLGIEPHLESIVETPEATLELLKHTPGLTLTLDYTHFKFHGISDDRIETLVPHASHFHARGGGPGRMQLPVSQNAIDYKQLVRAMKRESYRGFVCVEYCYEDWRRCNEADVLSETILMRDLLRSAEN